jgi:hypothetical protein
VDSGSEAKFSRPAFVTVYLPANSDFVFTDDEYKPCSRACELNGAVPQGEPGCGTVGQRKQHL